MPSHRRHSWNHSSTHVNNTPKTFINFKPVDHTMARKNSRKGLGIVTFTDTETHWMKLSLCVGDDTEKFFPPRIEETRAIQLVPPEVSRICGQCRVKTECFEFAMKHDLIGIWGDTTDYTRNQLKKANHKPICPGCSSDDLLNEFDGSSICSSCGLSWVL